MSITQKAFCVDSPALESRVLKYVLLLSVFSLTDISSLHSC